MNDTWADIFRVCYGILGFLCAGSFAATLRMRWGVLKRGERILRSFLVVFFVVVVYGAYVAIDRSFPPTPVGLLATISLCGVVFGFVVWFVEDLIPGNRNINRLTDPATPDEGVHRD